MDQQSLNRTLIENFLHEPNEDQKELISTLSQFLSISNYTTPCFIIKGYAGTGKTTIISSLVKTLPKFKYQYCLLAPTGRAAKVMSNYSGVVAFTIHKKIYQYKQSDEISAYSLAPNKTKNCVFIIDEASMISSRSEGKLYNDLLSDLIRYVKSGDSCKLIFVGDTAQLPPVGMTLSNALQKSYIRRNFSLEVAEYELKDVVRQSADSGILFNATNLRDRLLGDDIYFPKIKLDFSDIRNITGNELEDELDSAYGKNGDNEVILVTRSNKRANLFNQQIRTRIKWQEERINASDKMMVVKNNYFWLDKKSKVGFIANGDFIEILSIQHLESRYGFDFIDASIKLLDYQNQPVVDAKILLDTIDIESANLPRTELKKLFKNIELDFMDIGSKKDRYVKVFNSPYFNALQVKFGYAVTCHKSQGGQWDAVFLDLGYVTEEMMDTEFYRWLYTAITRAKKDLFLLNFPPVFFND